MTKAELTQEISNKTGIDKRTVLTIIESLMTELKESLAQGEDVYLRGFGCFIIKRRATKTARNISKNTTILVPAHDIPAFKPSKEFIKSISELDTIKN